MVIFENLSFLAVDKRPGWLSVPSRFGAKETRPCEVAAWSKEKGIKLFPVHRLDEEVSGILLMAKTPEAHRASNGWFERREIKKRYEALSEGTEFPAPQSKFEWESLLLRGKKRAYEKPFGKKSVTEAHFLEIRNEFGLWNLNPLTGRSHQLRYEMAKHGFPIVGDSLYGAKTKLPREEAIALRAVELNLSGCAGREVWELPEKLEASSLQVWLK